MSRVSVLVPTRNRPANVERLLSSAYQTAALPPEFIFYVDDDDPSFDTTQEVVARFGARLWVGERIVLSQMWNKLAELATNDVLMHCGDDIIFRSQRWDELVTNAFDAIPDKIGVVHGRDGFQDQRLATHGFYHRRWVDVLGYLVPPYFSSDYNDLWNTELADTIGRRWYLPDVYTEHMHPVVGKAPLDATHQERLARHERDGVDALYASLASRRAGDVEKLRAAIAAEVSA